MPVSTSDIDAINAAIANPERQDALNGQQVFYRSVAELICAPRRTHPADGPRTGRNAPEPERIRLPAGPRALECASYEIQSSPFGEGYGDIR